MRRMVLVVVALLALAAPALAQSPALTWQLQVFQVGVDPLASPAPTAFYTLDLPAAIVTCNTTQTIPAQTAGALNPRTVWWQHPDLAGQVCKGDLSGQTAFIALPAGGPYPTALVAVNAAGPSPRGVAEFPFTRLDPARAPTRVVLR